MARTDHSDERAVSITINHVLTLGITTILMVGLFATVGSFVEGQTESAGQHELEVIGNRLAAEIQIADRLAQRGGTVSMTIAQPPTVSSGRYSVELQTGSDCQGATINASTCLSLVSEAGGKRVKVPVANTTNVAVNATAPGTFVIEAEPTAGSVDARGGATSDVGIDVGVGQGASSPLVDRENVSISNRPPVAKFYFDPASPSTNSTIHFTANESADADGNVTAYRWDLNGDGTVDKTGQSFDYSYTEPDKYNVTLVVQDDDGDTDQISKVVLVSGLVYEKDVVARDYTDTDSVPGGTRFNLTNYHNTTIEIEQVLIEPQYSSIQYLSSSASGPNEGESELFFSPDVYSEETEDASGYDLRDGGHIVDLGDEPSVGSDNSVLVAISEFHGTSPSDDVNMTGRPVDVAVRYRVSGEDEYYTSKFTLFGPGRNTAPRGRFSVSCSAQTCSFDATNSTDSDGTVVDYEWHFGDGTNATGPTPTHVYPANGTYQPTLTVTDDNGTSSSVTKTLIVGDVDLSLDVNFQPDGVTPPSGYLEDAGKPFGNRGNGYAYGWSSPNTGAARLRNYVADKRWDTLVHVNGKQWELAVPSATYRVEVFMGDPAYFDQTNGLTIEGTTVSDPDPYSEFSDHEDVATATVSVTDGRLTISPGPDANNAKLAFLHVEEVNPRPFNASADRVVVEAENYANLQQGSDDMEGLSWRPVEEGSASSGVALYADPDYDGWVDDPDSWGWIHNPFNAGDSKDGPRLDYNVELHSSGTYYAWARMKCTDSSSDSVHVGIDGQPATYGGDGLSTGCTGASGYTWVNRVDGSLVTMDVSSAGTHTLNLWMREDGVYVDKIILTKDPGYAPTTSEGPPESTRA